MKSAISFVIILAVHTAYCFPRCQRPPSFTEELKASYAMFINILGYVGSHDFNKAHVVPWLTIKREIYAQDPLFSYTLWTTEVKKLIDDLHSIDYGWFGNKKLQEAPQKWSEYILKNKRNKRKCEKYLEMIGRKQIRKMKKTNKPTKTMKDLCKCLFSAPAIIRPGYRVTNDLVRSHIDPLTTSKPGREEVIKCSDITERSKTVAKKYNLRFLQYNSHYASGGIATSDQSPKAKELLLKPFSTTQC